MEGRFLTSEELPLAKVIVMSSRKFIRLTFPVLLVVGLYFIGPAPQKPLFDKTMPVVPAVPDQLEKYIEAREAQHVIKNDNEARIIWQDSTKRKTEYAVVYLHGFSASRMEGYPVHERFAKAFGANLFLPRLSDHGVDTTEALLFFTADRAWESAKEALAIGKQLGERVILISTSTGGTLALKLAAEYPQDVYALINLSPNIELNNGAAFLLNDPWGLYIARTVMGGLYMETDASDEEAKYWNKKYRLEALTELEQLVEETMNEETFRNIHHPSLTLYYYKNEDEQDPQVKVSAMLKMNNLLGTPDSLKVAKAFPEAGVHVIGHASKSKDVEGVYHAMVQFAVEKLHMVHHTGLAMK
jgi:pimeloyl-ACP methyl ester carboxylesterase